MRLHPESLTYWVTRFRRFAPRWQHDLLTSCHAWVMLHERPGNRGYRALNPPGGIPNPNGGEPPESGRFSSTNQPEAKGGRTPTAWLRKKLTKAMKGSDISAREAIADHLIEVATSWEVVIKGRGEEAMPVSSAKDSIEAAKVLWAYDMGKPIESIEVSNNDATKVLIYLPSNGRETKAETKPGSQEKPSDDGSNSDF